MFFSSKRNYSFDQIPDLTGKTAIVTGGNSGIGKISALELARKGCTVILACRSEEKANAALEEIKSKTGNNNVEFIQLDMLSLSSVKQFAETFLSRHNRLYILLNNAGVMAPPFSLSKDRIESQFATNHVAHFYLTMLLLPTIKNSAPSRIVNVSSVMHQFAFGGLQLESINDPKKYNKDIHYARSKSCNILFTRELTDRLQENEVYVNCCHPGAVKTELQRYSTVGRLLRFAYIEPEDGALTQLYLATSPEVEEKNIRGQYYVPYGVASKPCGVAGSQDAPLKLWEFTEDLLNTKIPDYTRASL